LLVFIYNYTTMHGHMNVKSMCRVGLNEHEHFFIPVCATCLNIVEEFLAFCYSTHELFPSERSSCLWRRAGKTWLSSKRGFSVNLTPYGNSAFRGTVWSTLVFSNLCSACHSKFCIR